MKCARTASVLFAVAAFAGAQRIADFECQSPGAVPPLAGTADCEGLVANGAVPGLTTVTGAAVCALPTAGLQYVSLFAAAEPGLNLNAGDPLPRPLTAPLTELRVPLGGGVVAVSAAFSWINIEGASDPTFNDGFDLSVVAADGTRIATLARGDTFAFPAGCSGVRTARIHLRPTPAGAYLSVVNYNEGDTAASNTLNVDDVVVERAIGFECETVGSSFGAVPDCAGVTGQTGAGGYAFVESAAFCSLPAEGTQFARLIAGGTVPAFTTGSTLARPVPADFTEIRIPAPAGAVAVAFDYAFLNAEGTNASTYIDGFDVSLVDAAGNPLLLLVNGDTGATVGGCNGAQRFSASLAPVAPGTFLSFVVFNEGDTFADSELLVDDVCFADRPQLTYFSPGGPGSLAWRIDCAAPGVVFYMPITLAAGGFPNGAFYGLDISVFDLFLQISTGAPFIGVTTGLGRFDQTPTFFGLPSGLTIYANVIADIASPTPDVGYPVSYTIP
jgi:hypothetical protein